jgi:hypothetical protein
MKPITFSIIISFGLLVSCYKPYTATVESNEEILIVDGMITNEAVSYEISLSYASPFYSDNTGTPLGSANVYVSDDLGNSYSFIEFNTGSYKSDPMKFTGQSGRTYTLHIKTSDGETYESGPQKLYREYYPDTVYAEADYQKTISRFNGIVVTVRGANILADINSETDTLPGFRFTSDLVELYIYALEIPPPNIDPPLYFFYCWQTDDISQDITLSENEYSLNRSFADRQEIYFIDDETYIEGIVYELGSLEPDFSYIASATPNRKSFSVSHRVLYLNQYSLNHETYLYYKSMDEQLSSEGKLFDPIAVQLTGNIKCLTDPNKKACGFFEASAVSRSAYKIGFRNHRDDSYLITNTPYNHPDEPDGCQINKIPPFWVN